jgi:tetratricopeptide (TPR) repeat protein
LGPAFRDALFSQTQGHALFTIELLRTMRDRGALTQGPEGEWLESEELRWDRLPTRVEAVIEERMDRLPAELRRLLTIACVEGAEFTLEATARVHGVDVQDLIAPFSLELEKRHRLVTAVGLRRVNGQRLSVFRFWHVLFQRHLYDGLSEVERVFLHDELGQALEALYGEQRSQVAIKLARHFQEAGSPEKAFTYMELAGTQARKMGSFAEAVGHFHGALEALRQQAPGKERDGRELELQLDLANVCSQAGRPAEGQQASARATELAADVGSETQRFWALWSRYWNFAHHTGDNRLGSQVTGEALSLAREVEDPRLVVHALEMVGRNAFLRGEFQEALDRYQELLTIYSPEEHRDDRATAWMDLGPTALGMVGTQLWHLGYQDQALARCEEAVAQARGLKSPSTLLITLYYLAGVRLFRGEHRYALELAEDQKRLADEVGLGGYWGPTMDVTLGPSVAQEGDVTRALEVIEPALHAIRATGWRIWVRVYAAFLADCLRLAGRAEEGLKVWEEADRSVEVTDELTHESERLRLKGELLRALPEPALQEAEDLFRTAIQIAQGQGAKSYELRATTSLALLLQEEGRIAEAKTVLRGSYGWFTEGFDTADLVAARELLEELDRSPPGLGYGGS